MEVTTESIGSPDQQGPKSPDEKPNDPFYITDDQKRDLFDNLYKLKQEANVDRCLSMALTLQTMFNQDIETLIKLFEFYLCELNNLEMAKDLCENDLFKNLNSADKQKSCLFDVHLNKFSKQLILASKCSNKESESLQYYQLFLLFSQEFQEKFIKLLLEKYKSIFAFFKVYSELTVDKAKQQMPANIDFKDFYHKLAEHRNELFEFRDLLIINKKFIPDYGIFLIDSFLNIDKNFYVYVVQKSQSNAQIDPILTSIERRSLNIMRRICVVDLVPEFVCLLDKLDNRHCYRWIEKSLEFYCKYTINSIQIENRKINQDENDDLLNLDYSSVKLMHDSELKLNELNVSEEYIIELRQNLKGLDEYKFERSKNLDVNENESENKYKFSNLNPFENVYKLLDELGKKLDWPQIDPSQLIEQKMTQMFNLKLKNDKQILMSSLNKQISFYGISFFFSKLIEFQFISKQLFADKIVMTQSFISPPNINKSELILNDDSSISSANDQTDRLISNLLFSLKLWHKFNQHKEFLTVITKCLSNSKLDSLMCYKIFLNDYYNSFQMTSSNYSANVQSYNSLNGLNLKQKCSLLANLFKHESVSFQAFFKELIALLDQVESTKTSSQTFYSKICISNVYFDLFELSDVNLLKYFSKLFLDKLTQIYELKKQNFLKFLSKNFSYIIHVYVLLQTNLDDSLFMSKQILSEFYDSIFNSLKTSSTPSDSNLNDIFEYIQDIRLLQDLVSLDHIFKQNNVSLIDKVKKNINNNIDSSLFDRHSIFKIYFGKNSQSLIDLFDQIVNC